MLDKVVCTAQSHAAGERLILLLQNRYTIDDSVRPPRIRANQGHSFAVHDLALQPVTDAAQVPFAVHVTGKQG